MADNVVETSLVEAPVVAQPDFSADLKAQMDIALNGGIPPQASEAAATDISQGTPATETTITTTTETATTQVANDPFGIFKEKFGYDTPDAAIKEIEELRAFRAQPRSPEFQVPDEGSAAILKALAAGKREDVWRALDHEMRVDRIVNAEVTKENAGDIVKMGMQLKYKDLTPDEINYKFKKQFAVPPKPDKLMDEDDVDYQDRVSTWQEQANDKYMELMIEAKLAKPEIQSSKGKFTIPEIETSVDEGYVQYQKMLEENAKHDEVTREAYKALTPEDTETKLSFKDEANKIAFEFQYKPNGELFNKAVEVASNADLFWGTFKNSDGSPNRKLFLESIMYALDKNNLLMSAMNQTKNATIKAGLPDNSQGGLVRQIAQPQEENELDKNMRLSLKGFGGF